MRKIKFRGKAKSNGQWVYGNLSYLDGGEGFRHVRIESQEWDGGLTRVTEVDPETVGQNTDIEDVNGKEIYEGDIVEFENSIVSNTGVVVWDRCNPCMAISYTHKLTNVTLYEYDFVKCGSMLIEVIGNIHDNPEFLEGLQEDDKPDVEEV